MLITSLLLVTHTLQASVSDPSRTAHHLNAALRSLRDGDPHAAEASCTTALSDESLAPSLRRTALKRRARARKILGDIAGAESDLAAEILFGRHQLVDHRRLQGTQ